MARESRGEKARRQILDLNISGLTDAEIARNLGVNRSTVGRWRKGQTSPRKGGKGGNLTRLWKRTDKALGEGGTVNLTSFFRRVWVQDGEAQLPLTIQPLPTYSFPPNAPVYMLAIFSDWINSLGENWGDKVLRVNLNLGETGGDKITTALFDAMAAQANYPLVYARVDFVLLRRGAN
tara:strand:- start:318 stop:851 length:534 start_codon:yes stop_codon:yes gene_type:complete